jgi:molecular chaperone GrpE
MTEEQVVLSVEEYERLQQLAREAEQRQDQLLRLAAECENAKKRMEREKQDYAKWATESLILALLPIIDSFDAALQNLKHHDVKDPVVTGVRLINQQLHELLKREGVERLQAFGQPFDPERHEVIQQVETNEQPDHTVIEEIQAGYMLRGRLIRPAMVKIATAMTTPSEAGGNEDE